MSQTIVEVVKLGYAPGIVSVLKSVLCGQLCVCIIVCGFETHIVELRNHPVHVNRPINYSECGLCELCICITPIICMRVYFIYDFNLQKNPTCSLKTSPILRSLSRSRFSSWSLHLVISPSRHILSSLTSNRLHKWLSIFLSSISDRWP